MKNKLEVGMYAYSKKCRDYGIGKIVNITENGLGFKGDLTDIQYRHSKHAIENHDVIASYNIIDIFEVGDVIIDKEGHKYPINYEFETDYNGEYKSYEITIDDHITLFLKDGLSIVTHEQMEQMSYRIGD